MNYIIPKLIIVNFLIQIYTAEPFIAGFLGAVSVGLGALIFHQKSLSCMFNECCDDKSKWITRNITRLEHDLKDSLHGQHLVKLALLKHLKGHILTENPEKALIFSFNGMSGTGKNFVSTMIANMLFKKGMKSKYVHFFISNVHFPYESKLEEYKETLRKKIMDAVKQCPRSLFIFDEVHDMPGNLLDVIKPFADYLESVNGVDFKKAIFILLSNSGGKDINTKLIRAYVDGRERESLTLKEMEEALVKPLFEMKNDGLRNSKLISHGLITAFIPFLPLEKKHVVLCIKNTLKEKKLEEDEEIIERVIETLDFEKAYGLEFSVGGCKRITEKLQLFL